MCAVCQDWGIKYLNLSTVEVSRIGVEIAEEEPSILISSIEKINDPLVQKELFNLKLEYIAVDEAQVLDTETGWTEFRPYSAETWAFLRARFKCPFLLCSATMEDDSLSRIADNLALPREKIKVLYSNPNRGNIYHQRRTLKQPVDIMNLSASVGFIIPAMMDSNFKKCQIFCSTRYMTDIVCAWLKSELKMLEGKIPHSNSISIEKLTGDNTRAEKERVMNLFKSGECQVLVCTDVAGMGVDVRDLTCAVNIGIPKNAWKMKQQSGRLGRNGEQSVDVTIVFPQKGASAPESKLRGAIKGSSCIRSAMNKLFVLSDPLMDYSADPIPLDCPDAGCELSDICLCSLCQCCSVCTEMCTCMKALKDENIKFASLLGFGDDNYRLAKEMLNVVDIDSESSQDGDADNVFEEEESEHVNVI